MKIRHKVLLLSCLMLVGAARADIGVAVGHHTWSKDDGGNYLPEVGPKEQISIFYCVGANLGAKAEKCAVDKCIKKFGDPKKCAGDGWTRRRGYSVAYAGPPGNYQLFSKALGSDTRENALCYVKSNKFPMEGATKIIDLYDDSGSLDPDSTYKCK